jgi:hypothetical protein
MNLGDFVEIAKDKRVQELMSEKSLKFLFVGSKNSFLKELLDDTTRAFFDFKEYIPHNEALQLMADSSGLLILGSNSPQRLNRKVFEYTALNRNIYYLGNTQSPTAKVVNEFDGVVCDRNDKIEKMVYFIVNLSYRKITIDLKYSKKNIVDKLIDILKT